MSTLSPDGEFCLAPSTALGSVCLQRAPAWLCSLWDAACGFSMMPVLEEHICLLWGSQVRGLGDGTHTWPMKLEQKRCDRFWVEAPRVGVCLPTHISPSAAMTDSVPGSECSKCWVPG